MEASEVVSASVGLQLMLCRLELAFKPALRVATADAAVRLLGLGLEVEDGGVEGVDGDAKRVALLPRAAHAVCVRAAPEHALVPEQAPHLIDHSAAQQLPVEVAVDAADLGDEFVTDDRLAELLRVHVGEEARIVALQVGSGSHRELKRGMPKGMRVKSDERVVAARQERV